MDDKLLILRAFSTLNQVRDAKVPELNLLPSFHELVEDLRARLAQPELEPVAWMYVNADGECEQIEYGEVLDDPSVTPLYTAPPQREWQGLTAEDLAEIPPSCFEGAIWADARLREKNT
jgi:hypothetical protein